LRKNSGKNNRNSTRNEHIQPVFDLFGKAYKAILKKNKKPTMKKILRELQEGTYDDDAWYVDTYGKGSITYNDIEIPYSTLKHWLGDLNKQAA